MVGLPMHGRHCHAAWLPVGSSGCNVESNHTHMRLQPTTSCSTEVNLASHQGPSCCDPATHAPA